MIQDTLKKITTQIKYGRLVEAEKALLHLLASPAQEDRVAALPIYVDMQMQTHEYADAARAIKEGLQLPLPEDLTATLKEKLAICEFEVNRKPVEPNYDNPDFVAFFAAVPELLQRSQVHAAHPFIELTDPRQAKACAHDQSISAPYFSWNAARTSASKAVFSYCFENQINLSKFDSDIALKIAEACSRIVTEQHPGFYYCDDMEADLTLIARGLLVGKTPPLFAKMRIAYEAKLFPCGWKGLFPEGELLVFRLW
jgi:hypothetical protein